MNYRMTVFLADLSPVIGSELRGKRPVIVVSEEEFTRCMPVMTILPITSRKPGRTIYPNETLLPAGTAGLNDDSIVLAHQIRTIAKQRLQQRLGNVTDASVQAAILTALRIHLDL